MVAREGNAMWRADDLNALQPVLTPMEIGALEKSNVNPVVAMTQLINTQRSYEMYTKAIDTVRNIEQKTSQELG
jgi:flagellar basal body rod protein FlgG